MTAGITADTVSVLQPLEDRFRPVTERFAFLSDLADHGERAFEFVATRTNFFWS